MSATGPISNYYVDSLISHDNEDLLASRFPATGAHPAAARPSGLVPDCSDFPSCSFAPKPAVFSTSWAPVPSQSSVVYHPYGPQPHLGADTRYMRTWLEPLSGAVSFPSFPAGGRHYALKPDAYPGRRADCGPGDGRSYPDYMYGSPGELRDRAPQTLPSPEADALAGSKHKEEKADLDPSKLGAIFLYNRRGRGGEAERGEPDYSPSEWRRERGRGVRARGEDSIKANYLGELSGAGRSERGPPRSQVGRGLRGAPLPGAGLEERPPPRPPHPQPRLFGSVVTFEEMQTGPGAGVGARFILWFEVGWGRDEEDTRGREKIHPTSQPAWGVGVLTPLEMNKTQGLWTSLPGPLSAGSGGTWRDRTCRVGGEKWGPSLKLESPLLRVCRREGRKWGCQG